MTTEENVKELDVIRRLYVTYLTGAQYFNSWKLVDEASLYDDDHLS